MQAKLKEEIDADRNENYVSITDYKTRGEISPSAGRENQKREVEIN